MLFPVGVALVAGCDRQASSPPTGSRLEPLRSIDLEVPEPSDLCLDRDGVHGWTVSDQTGRVYRLRLSDGVVDRTLDFTGTDLEGVWQDPADASLYVAEEGLRQVVHLDSTGRELGRVEVAGLSGDPNSGLEGITANPANGHFFVVNEKDPALLLSVAPDGRVLASHAIPYLADLSGVTWDAARGQLLLISDQSAAICRVDTAGGLLARYDIDVTKAEGVALDPVTGHLYVVSDDLGRFYEFAPP